MRFGWGKTEDRMPVYSYRCDNCGVQFDRYQRFSDKPLSKCPECGESALRKLFQPAGIVFKGSGFYVTDNRSSKNPASAASHNGSTESDSKPEANKKTAASPSKED
jgi:putative FmdB family regulatory protein